MSSQTLSPQHRAWRWRILIATYVAYAGFYLVRKVFSICKSTLAAPVEDGGYGMGFDAVANIWAAYLIAYMVGQFVNSYIGRKWGPRTLLLGGLGISMLCNVVFGFTNSYYTFVVFMIFNGLVQAAGWPGCVGGVAEWLRREDRGTIMGFWTSSYAVGSLVVNSAAGFFLLHFGVPYAFWGCTLIAFGVWWLIWFWQRDRPEDVGLSPIIDPEDDEGQAVEANESTNIQLRDYLRLLVNPVILLMGCSYFCVKFLRYALGSWLPTFLDLQGMDVASAAYYSSIFDLAGLPGAILAGFVLDKYFHGRWEWLCLFLGVGLVAGYLSVVQFGANPYALSFCFGLVGFMLYGPDTILSGTGSVGVAGERNAVAVAGIINGIGSIGPVVQEKVIGWLLEGQASEIAIRNSNILGLGMSMLYLATMASIVVWIHFKKPHTV